MAKSDAVWGIDIGQCALKALRCRPHDDPSQIVADAFDYIEYPKILSQPEAEPAELIRDALKQFLSRNSVRGDRVAISVSGQSGLARFIKLPPVESKKIPDIVKYEAKQQIPFALEDVVWDYQQMGVGSEEEGFALETEVGLFAMKRDQVYRALKPFIDAGIEVDLVQLTPLALYNYITFDQFKNLASAEEYDPENPPESTVVLSMGTDTTDLVVTNGYRVWQRSIPLGGNHFTKALTKELKLTFAKAEHLKRNAAQAEDPKAVFQAMRPVFNDLLTEVQRSIGYFTSVDRTAKIGRVVTLGNAMKLPGLQRYLAQNLGFEVVPIDSFRGLTGPEVIGAPAFKDNLLCFGVCYGLTLQGMKRGKLLTNLLPREIVKDRVIRAKKPWAAAAVAVLLLGCAVNYLGHIRALGSVDENSFKGPVAEAESTAAEANKFITDFEAQKTQFVGTDTIGQHLVRNVEGRLLWPELLKAINICLPADPPGKAPADVAKRNVVYLTSIESQRIAASEVWLAEMQKQGWYQPPGQPAAGQGAADPAAAPATAPVADPAAAPTADPAAADTSGAAQPTAGAAPEYWVIQLKGHHYHNDRADQKNQGAQFVRNTLLKNLEQDEIKIARPGGVTETIPVKKLGILHPLMIDPKGVDWDYVEDSEADQAAAVPTGRPAAVPAGVAVPAGGAPAAPAAATVKPGGKQRVRYDFEIQFCWQPTPLSKRLQIEKAKADQAKAAAAAAAAAAGSPAEPAKE
ncbi:MAG: type IV pilus assembly protein PilM [Pirellulales bacterium]